VSPSGAVLDTGIVCGMDHYCECHPSVAFDGEQFLVVWYNYIDPPAGIYGRFIDQDCIPVGREFSIRDLPINTCNDPDIAFLDSVYLVVWSEPSPVYDEDVYGQVVHANGTLIGDAIAIAIDTTYQYEARVCAADTMFIVVWYQNSYVYGQFIGQNGALIGNNFQITDLTNNPRDFPDLAYGGPQPLTVWHEFINDDHDIYGDMEMFPGVNDLPSRSIRRQHAMPTIYCDQLMLPAGKKCKVYDISGRRINSLNPAPGIYFLLIDGEMKQKIIKIK
jgi:hypothetical protein